jgi:hypothetical protein
LIYHASGSAERLRWKRSKRLYARGNNHNNELRKERI